MELVLVRGIVGSYATIMIPVATPPNLMIYGPGG
jgi:di/tricarboxylate transporter